MTSKARTRDEIAAMYGEHLEGHVIKGLLVHGVNALKSMDPHPDQLVGQSFHGLEFTSDTIFNLSAGALVLEVDLQRTGQLKWTSNLTTWSFGQPSMPTGQLLLDGAEGVNFVEPAKTKRITFRVLRAET